MFNLTKITHEPSELIKEQHFQKLLILQQKSTNLTVEKLKLITTHWILTCIILNLTTWVISEQYWIEYQCLIKMTIYLCSVLLPIKNLFILHLTRHLVLNDFLSWCIYFVDHFTYFLGRKENFELNRGSVAQSARRRTNFWRFGASAGSSLCGYWILSSKW